MITFNILTLFPEVFPGILQHGLLGKALLKSHFKINTINIRDYSDLSANSVDDKPFSGGAGMIVGGTCGKFFGIILCICSGGTGMLEEPAGFFFV